MLEAKKSCNAPSLTLIWRDRNVSFQNFGENYGVATSGRWIRHLSHEKCVRKTSQEKKRHKRLQEVETTPNDLRRPAAGKTHFVGKRYKLAAQQQYTFTYRTYAVEVKNMRKKGGRFFPV